MTSTFDPLQLGGCDDAAAVLAHARAQKQVEDDAAREVMQGRRGLGRDALVRFAGRAGRTPGTRPRCRWAARGARRWRSSRWSSSPPPWAGPPSPGAATWPRRSRAATGSHAAGPELEAGDLQAWRLQIHRRTHPVPVAGRGGVRRHPRRTGGAQDRPRPAGPADHRSHRPVRPRAAPKPNAKRPPTPAASTSTSTRSAPPGPCTSRATSTSPTPSTSTPPSPPTPTNSCSLGSTESLDVRRSIAAGNLARTPAHARPQQRTPTRPGRRRQRRQVVLHVHLHQAAVHGSGTAPATAPAAWPACRRPRGP